MYIVDVFHQFFQNIILLYRSHALKNAIFLTPLGPIIIVTFVSPVSSSCVTKWWNNVTHFIDAIISFISRSFFSGLYQDSEEYIAVPVKFWEGEVSWGEMYQILLQSRPGVTTQSTAHISWPFVCSLYTRTGVWTIIGTVQSGIRNDVTVTNLNSLCLTDLLFWTSRTQLRKEVPEIIIIYSYYQKNTVTHTPLSMLDWLQYLPRHYTIYFWYCDNCYYLIIKSHHSLKNIEFFWVH